MQYREPLVGAKRPADEANTSWSRCLKDFFCVGLAVSARYSVSGFTARQSPVLQGN